MSITQEEALKKRCQALTFNLLSDEVFNLY